MDLFVSAGQFDYQNVNPAHQSPSADTFILAWQLGATVNIAKDEAFKVAPMLYNYTGHGSSAGLNTPFVGQGTNGVNVNTKALNQDGINDLLILEVPGEFTFPIACPALGPLQGRLFGDFAYNFEGDDRARAAFNANKAAFTTAGPVTGENKAYQVGLGIGNQGSTFKKGTWDARGYWQHTEQYALDVNLIDSDVFEGRANLEGIYATVSYSFTDAILGRLSYGYASRINSDLGTGGANLDLPQINPINNFNLFQADLTWRF